MTTHPGHPDPINDGPHPDRDTEPLIDAPEDPGHREETFTVGAGPWLLLVVAFVVTAVLILGLQESSSNDNMVGWQGTFRAEARQALVAPRIFTAEGGRTAGTVGGVAIDANRSFAPASTLQTVDAILARGRSAIGEHVQLQVPELDRANAVAFWVGTYHDRVLVVLRRDTRSDLDRQLGQIEGNQIAPLTVGNVAIISGQVKRLPRAEDQFSWRLTTSDHLALDSAGYYIEATRVEAAPVPPSAS